MTNLFTVFNGIQSHSCALNVQLEDSACTEELTFRRSGFSPCLCPGLLTTTALFVEQALASPDVPAVDIEEKWHRNEITTNNYIL